MIIPELELKKVPDEKHEGYVYYECIIKNSEEFPDWTKVSKIGWGQDNEDTKKSADRKIKKKASEMIKSTLTYEDYDKLWDKLDEKAISQVITTNLALHSDLNPKFKKASKIARDKNFKRYELVSDVNLVQAHPMLRAAWKEMHLETFNSWNGVDSEGNLRITLSLYYRYEHTSGGSNGAECFTLVVFDNRVELRDMQHKIICSKSLGEKQ